MQKAALKMLLTLLSQRSNISLKNHPAPEYFYISPAASTFVDRKSNSPADLLKSQEELLIARNGTKTKFCVLMAKNRSPTMEGCEIREKMATVLGERKTVDRCCNDDSRQTDSYLDDSVLKYSDYKFAIVMENTEAPGYITEKIVSAFLGSAIPIFWGHTDVSTRELSSVCRTFPTCMQLLST
jgi:hypothetical protein